VRKSHVSVLVLKVGLSVVTDDPVGVSGRVRFLLSGSNFSVQVVVQSLEQTFSQVHVANRVDAFGELNGAGNLSVPVAPVMLNAFQMPLVDENDNLLALRLIDDAEKFIVFLVNEDLLVLGEEDGQGLDKPVHLVLVQTLFSVRRSAHLSNLCSFGIELITPSTGVVLESPNSVLGQVEASLVVKSLPSVLVELTPEEFDVRADLFGSFAG